MATYKHRPLLRGAFFLFLLVLSILVCSIGAAASADWLAQGKYDFSHASFQDNTYTNHFNNTVLLSTIGYGSNFSLLAGDYDADGSIESFVTSGSTVRFYYSSGNSYILENEFNIISTVQAWSGNVDDTLNKEIVTYNGSDFQLLRYNGTGLNVTCNAIAQNIITGISCSNFSGIMGCYAGNSSGWLYEFSPTYCNVSAYNIQSPNNIFNVNEGTAGFSSSNKEYYTAPIISDIDNDGVKELVFLADPDLDGLDGYVVINQNSFNVDINKSDISSGNQKTAQGFLVYNLNGAGNEEICFTMITPAVSEASTLKCFKADGTQYGTTQSISSGSSYGYTFGLAMCNINSSKRLCTVGLSNTPVNSEIAYCYTVSSDAVSLYTSQQTTYNSKWFNHFPNIACADVTGDGNEELILPDVVLNVAQGKNISLGLTYPNFYYAGSTIPIDINNDNVLELCGQTLNYGYCAYSGFTDGIPTLTDTYGRNYDNPICTNTTLRFSAKEYDENAAQPSGTNYYNDVDTDTERLAADCFSNGTLVNGSFDLANPYVNCIYNTTGTFTARVYLQDNANPADYSQYADVNVLVIEGSPGVSCNAESLPIGETGINGTTSIVNVNPTTNGVNTFMNFFTGGSQSAKIFIGFLILVLITVGAAAMVASVTHSGAAVAIVCAICALAGFVCLTAIGMFPVWILIVLMLGLAVLAVLMIGLKAGGI